MIKQEVIFNVKNLKISKTENIFATEGIKNVFTAVFQFHSTDWDGLAKTAVFENAEGTKEPKLLEEDRCDIPDSFFKTSGVCYVSVMAGDFMVTNKVAIIVVNAGYTSGDTVAEAKNYFEQILRYFDATNMNVQKYGKLAERFAVGLAEDRSQPLKVWEHFLICIQSRLHGWHMDAHSAVSVHRDLLFQQKCFWTIIQVLPVRR